MSSPLNARIPASKFLPEEDVQCIYAGLSGFLRKSVEAGKMPPAATLVAAVARSADVGAAAGQPTRHIISLMGRILEPVELAGLLDPESKGYRAAKAMLGKHAPQAVITLQRFSIVGGDGDVYVLSLHTDAHVWLGRVLVESWDDVGADGQVITRREVTPGPLQRFSLDVAADLPGLIQIECSDVMAQARGVISAVQAKSAGER